ncbi:DUF2642 domain-containing protein [Alkalibacillus haloalkaliphilus]|uniref:DUF2642 domain-containing protein n=1 Tax=Alkalibacillus haloalkaliphilus TaxID=94136 RepID=UPI0002F846BE|nr:DUF2642 domain-containing protein [Alkalibacillus haloalkaliphilus]
MYYNNPNYTQYGYPQMPRQDEQEVGLLSLSIIEPFMFYNLQGLNGSNVVVQTTQGAERGKLVEATPDHITMEVSGNYYFIRMQEIVWVMPTNYEPDHI